MGSRAGDQGLLIRTPKRRELRCSFVSTLVSRVSLGNLAVDVPWEGRRKPADRTKARTSCIVWGLRLHQPWPLGHWQT